MRKRTIGIGYFLVLSIVSVAFEACEGDVANEPAAAEGASVVDSASLFDIFYGDVPDGGPSPPACYISQDFGENGYSPPVAHQNVCTTADINDYYDECIAASFSGPDAGACGVFGETRTACASCLSGETPCWLQHPGDPDDICDGGNDDEDAGDVANSWPPIIPISDTSIGPDTAACIAALSSASDDCKTAYAYEWQCVLAMCSNCPASDIAACRSYAAIDPSGCSALFGITPACLAAMNAVDPNVAITQCAAPFPDGGAPDLHSGYTTVATTLCGP